ncbi:hypothetical protein [Robertmurraya sp. Marseille-Q9965]
MKYSKGLLLVMLVFPWLTLPFLGKGAVKRFLAASILISLVVRIESIFAKKQRWWWFYEKLHPKLKGEFPLIWGPFFIGSMWILKITYGKFPMYLLTNLIIDTLFTYPFVTFLKKTGIGSLVRLKTYQLSLLFFLKSLLLYGFQYLKEIIQGEKIENL